MDGSCDRNNDLEMRRCPLIYGGLHGGDPHCIYKSVKGYILISFCVKYIGDCKFPPNVNKLMFS